MRFLIVVLCALLVVLPGEIEAQYPHEDCQYECEVIYCDYYYDYCDYDCHEVCYPYSPPSPLRSSKVSSSASYLPQGDIAKQGKSQRSSVKTDSSPQLPSFFAASLAPDVTQQVSKTRTGKVVRMKIANPSFQTINRGQVVMTRGSPPRGFALFQSCLSTGQNRAADSGIFQQVHQMEENRQVQQGGRQHLVFGNSDVSIKARL